MKANGLDQNTEVFIQAMQTHHKCVKLVFEQKEEEFAEYDYSKQKSTDNK